MWLGQMRGRGEGGEVRGGRAGLCGVVPWGRDEDFISPRVRWSHRTALSREGRDPVQCSQGPSGFVQGTDGGGGVGSREAGRLL